MEPRALDAAVVLEQAAVYINDHGWTQGTFRSTSGSVCVGGALRTVVAWGNPNRLFSTRAQQDAYFALWSHINRGKKRTQSGNDWNDDPSRTREEVLETLMAVALDLRDGQYDDPLSD